MVDLEFVNPGMLGTEQAFREGTRCRSSASGRRKRRGAAAHHPAVRLAAVEDGQDDHLRPAGQAGDEGLLQPEPGAGQPLRGDGHRHAVEDRRGASTRSPGAAGAGHHGQAQAGLQPPGAPARRRFPLAGRSGKLARLKELCEEIAAEGDRAPCFTQYAELGRMPQPDLSARIGCRCSPARRHVEEAAGRARRPLPAGRRARAVRAVAEGGGTGLNLTAACHVIHFDRWWNPAVENQATDRAFRIGQRRNVLVHKFVCRGTVEERIDAMIEQKKSPRRADRRHRRGLAHRTVHRRAARGAHAVVRGGVDMEPVVRAAVAGGSRSRGGIKAESKWARSASSGWSWRFIVVLVLDGMSSWWKCGRSDARRGQASLHAGHGER